MTILQPATRYPRIARHLSNAQQYLSSIEEATEHEGERREAQHLRKVLLDCNKRIWAAEQDSRARMNENYVRLEET